MNSCAPTARAAAATSSGARVGPAEDDVLAHRAREQEPLLRDDAELAPQALLRHVAEVVAVDRDRPSRGS